MNIYTCTKFTGHYPVGVAAVVNASDPKEAAETLNAKLREHHLKGDAVETDMTPFPLQPTETSVRILCDGDY